MKNKPTSKDRLLVIGGAVALAAALALIGGLIYALNVASLRTLRWWAGIATVVLPLAAVAAFFVGRMEARGHVAGLAQGIEAVSRAAKETADIRVTTTQRLRRREPTPAVQQVFMPGMPGIGGGEIAGVIMPPRHDDADVEL